MHELGEAVRIFAYLEVFKTLFGLLMFPFVIYFIYLIFRRIR